MALSFMRLAAMGGWPAQEVQRPLDTRDAQVLCPIIVALLDFVLEFVRLALSRWHRNFHREQEELHEHRTLKGY